MMRYLLAAVPAFVILVVVVALVVLWLFGVPWRVGGAPVQPVAFYHSVHVNTVKLDCLFCHRQADKGPAATVPAVEQCMFCHSVITSSGAPGAEIAKVRAAWQNRQPIDWTRVYELPDHVHFVHQPHIARGFACATCHGDVPNLMVGNLNVVYQYRSLRMGDCLTCHRANGGTTDCFKCHY